MRRKEIESRLCTRRDGAVAAASPLLSLSLSFSLSLSLSHSRPNKVDRPEVNRYQTSRTSQSPLVYFFFHSLSLSSSFVTFTSVQASYPYIFFYIMNEYIYIYTQTHPFRAWYGSWQRTACSSTKPLRISSFFLNILSFLRSFPSRNYFQFFSPEIGREVFLYVSCEWQTWEKSCWCNVISEIDENRFSRYPCCCFLYFHSREINVTLLYLGKFIWSLKNLVTDILGRNCYSTWKKRKTQIFIETLVLFTV